MATNDFSDEDYITFEQKWLCVLLVDVSASMSDESLLRVNEEICNFFKFIEKDEIALSRLELSVMTFGQDIKILQEPANVNSSAMPQIVRSSDVFHAVDCAVERIKARKRWYKETGQPYYRPLLVLVTSETIDELLQGDQFASIRKDVSEKQYGFLNYGMNDSNKSLSSILTTNHPSWYDYMVELPAMTDDSVDLKDLSWCNTFDI